MTELSHRRRNLLTGRWTLVSPQRLQRPWQGETATPAPPAPRHDPHCHLCPRNVRASGAKNPGYDGVFVFDNDYAALTDWTATLATDPLLTAEAESGVCRVVCYGPEHDLSLSGLGAPRVRAIIDEWAAQTEALGKRPDIGAVTIFENRGDMMGASSPHPHGQIWATASVPDELAVEAAQQADWHSRTGSPLLSDYLAREIAADERIVMMEDAFVVVVPWWAVWPFETLVLPRRPVGTLAELVDAERDSLARTLTGLTQRYDALFGVPFPYSMGWHQRPSRTPADGHFVLHAHFYPPLLRSASVRKHMVGFELLAMPQRDLTPEAAAERLRSAR